MSDRILITPLEKKWNYSPVIEYHVPRGAPLWLLTSNKSSKYNKTDKMIAQMRENRFENSPIPSLFIIF